MTEEELIRFEFVLREAARIRAQIAQDEKQQQLAGSVQEDFAIPVIEAT